MLTISESFPNQVISLLRALHLSFTFAQPPGKRYTDAAQQQCTGDRDNRAREIHMFVAKRIGVVKVEPICWLGGTEQERDNRPRHGAGVNIPAKRHRHIILESLGNIIEIVQS